MTTLEWATYIRTGEVVVWGPHFTKQGADNSSFEKATPIGVVSLGKRYPGYIGVVVATPEGPAAWMAEAHICRSCAGRILLLEDSVSKEYLNGEVITWGENLSWNSHSEEEEEEKEDDKITLDL